MTIYGYCRVSTEKQTKEGESLGTQERVIQGYCMMNNFTLTKTFIEQGISGSVPLADRPQGKELLRLLKPADIIITPKLDRMFRSSLDALTTLNHLKKNKISLHMLDLGGDVTTDTMAKLLFTVLSAFAELERDRISERIRDVKRDQKKRGEYLGGKVPFGYLLLDGNLYPHDQQQQMITVMKSLKKNGYSLRDISRHTGLSHSGVRNILNRV